MTSVPLGLIYPALLHLKACARTRKQKAADIILIAFGAIATVYTTVQTVSCCPNALATAKAAADFRCSMLS